MNKENENLLEEIVSMIESKSFESKEKIDFLLSIFTKVMDEDLASYVLDDFRVGSSHDNSENHIVRDSAIGVPLDILYSVIYEEK